MMRVHTLWGILCGANVGYRCFACCLGGALGWLFVQLLPLVSNKHMISLSAALAERAASVSGVRARSSALPVCLSVYPSIDLSVYLSFYLHVYVHDMCMCVYEW